MRFTVIRRLASDTLRLELSSNPSWWSEVSTGSPDIILDVSEAYWKDDNPNKVNLSVGMYRDDNGNPYVLPSVIMAEERMRLRSLDKEYAPTTGCQEFCNLTAGLALGKGNDYLKNGYTATAQGISGTGSLSLGAKFLAKFFPGNKLIYVPSPTWGNHEPLFTAAGLTVKEYQYYNAKTNDFNFTGAMDDIKKIPEKSIILFQASAHNPTGVDPKPAVWMEIAKVVQDRKLFPFFDLAYQGFASGNLSNDAFAVRHFTTTGQKIAVAQTYSKNMGLYGERIGAFTVTTGSKQETQNILSQLKVLIRSNYSTPPINGARIVTEVLSSPVVKGQWLHDMIGMSSRITYMRKKLHDLLLKEGSTRDWRCITDQNGMFCYTGLKANQVDTLVQKFSIHLPKDGRLCMGGVNSRNVEYIAQALHQVTK